MKNDICKIIKESNCKYTIDVFGGSGIIALNCDNEMIVYNDLHEGLYTFFKLLRNPETSQKLINKIQMTPYSRQEFLECKATWEKEEDEIEKARKFYVVTMQSVSTNGGWSYSKNKSRRGMSQAVSRWLGNIEQNLPDMIEKLITMQVENLNCIELIHKYDSVDTVFYLDPPYIQETRLMKSGYKYEFTIEQHIELVETLKNIKGKAVLSGYEHEIYKPLETNGWHKQLLGEYAKHSEKIVEIEHKKGKEFVWINYELGSEKLVINL